MRARLRHLTLTFAAALLACTAAFGGPGPDPAEHAGEGGPGMEGDVQAPPAQLFWLVPAHLPASQAPARLDIGVLAPELAARGVQVVPVTVAAGDGYGAGTATEAAGAALERALAQARRTAPATRRWMLGAKGDITALIDGALQRSALAHTFAGTVLFDPAVVEHGGPAPTAEPQLLLFDRTCPAPSADAGVAAPTPQADCRAMSDARFVDGAWTRAMAHPQAWLALVDPDAETPDAAAPDAAGVADPPALSRIETRVLIATVADYLAAFVHTGAPTVPGRPAWSAVDGAAAHYLHLGATVRAARDPLIDAVDLRDARAAASTADSTTDCRVPDCPATR